MTEIVRAAFFYCENLVSITIAKGVTMIRGDAFAPCKKLEITGIPFAGRF